MKRHFANPMLALGFKNFREAFKIFMKMEKAVYTHKQMCEMMSRTRSWTLNNPSGCLPYLPIQWDDNVTQEQNEKASNETMPPYKKTHKLVQLLMWLKVI